ncbi:MAG: tRNA (adenosine(37)-N6)-threonylcarbamoyltransferase complex dimerization subunit type 1 TsaB [Planctomycetaceae bacterium]
MGSPLLLAIDVTGPGGGAALLADGRVTRAQLGEGEPRGRGLAGLVRDLMRGAGRAACDLDGVVCGVGPGSFTGIRIGIATAGALAYAAGRPALAVGSLHGIAGNAPEGARSILVALDARRGRVYCAHFLRSDGRLVEAGPYRHVPPEESAAGLPAETFVLGDARERFPEVFRALPGSSKAPPRPDLLLPIAAERYLAGELPDPRLLRPLYLRLSDPEIKRQPRGDVA